jgi:hypothetical protein
MRNNASSLKKSKDIRPRGGVVCAALAFTPNINSQDSSRRSGTKNPRIEPPGGARRTSLNSLFRRRSGRRREPLENAAGLRAFEPATEVQMRKIFTAALAAATLGVALAGTAAPASAQPYRYGYYGGYYGGHHHHSDVAGPALAAGVLGLAVGAALGSSYYSHPSYGYSYPSYSYGYAPSYGYGYGYAPGYSGGYGYAPGYGYCQAGRWVWDPYIGRQVWVRSPC